MIYPKFLSRGDTIGITAPSAGVGNKIDSFEMSLASLKEAGYKTKETKNVRKDGFVSADAKTRAEELMSLFADDETSYMVMAAGGDFLMEMLPYVNFQIIKDNPKWVQGYSDITNLIYPITTLCDVATIYGLNAGGFDRRPLHKYQQIALEVMSGNVPQQLSYDVCSTVETRDGEFASPVLWKSTVGDFTASGRILGGCLDCLCETVAGTSFDGTLEFIERYKNDGIIWYFDIFSMSAEAVCRGLWKLKELGWFENATAFLFGRVMFPSTFMDMSYEEAARRALGENIPAVFDADIGHLPPSFTLINGASAAISLKNGQGKLEMFLK